MAATVSALQLAANRANSLLSTGPKSADGQLASSQNARTHGLTTRHALLPGEELAEYEAHHDDYLAHYRPQASLTRELVVELADIHWRLRRVSSFESNLLSMEAANLAADPELKPLIEKLDSRHLLALAFKRLVETKVLPNLLNQEARLARRAQRIENQLEGPQPPPTARPTEKLEAQPATRAAESDPPSLPIENRKNEPIRLPAKIGRNEPCPCNSGLKFKRCCLNSVPRRAGSEYA